MQFGHGVDQHVGALDARNSPTQTMSAASALGATGAISAALMPFGTTRTMPRGVPTIAS